MNKSNLIEALATQLKIPLQEAKSITTTILNAMTEALVTGNHIP